MILIIISPLSTLALIADTRKGNRNTNFGIVDRLRTIQDQTIKSIISHHAYLCDVAGFTISFGLIFLIGEGAVSERPVAGTSPSWLYFN
ncbi:MAG: hypothetical protein JWN70_1239 [Planctomycetaceae bacterium]|nr:hypothetical protein [Planctomycetaceae bacterium]